MVSAATVYQNELNNIGDLDDKPTIKPVNTLSQPGASIRGREGGCPLRDLGSKILMAKSPIAQ